MRIGAAFRISRRHTARLVLTLLVGGSVAIIIGTLGNRQSLEVGRPAPDFALSLLKQTDNGGRAGVAEHKIRLSAFRRKRVVYLFMSSYT
jgi:hypothetical protein